jgi:hypothetical protein
VDGAAGLNSTYITATRTIFQGKSWKNGVAGLNYSYKVCLLYTQKTYIISSPLGGYGLGFYTFIALFLQKLLFQPFLPISLLTECIPPAIQLSFLTPSHSPSWQFCEITATVRKSLRRFKVLPRRSIMKRP